MCNVKIASNFISMVMKSNFTNYSVLINSYFRPFLITNSRKFSAVKETINEQSNDVNDKSSSQASEVEQNDLHKELLGKIETLSEEMDILKDKYQRTLADRENVRSRLENQIRESKMYGIQSFCKDLLEVSDVFRKAIESVSEEKVITADNDFKQLYDGVVMTEHQLLTAFRRHGLEQIKPIEGDKFDPSYQEAMFEIPSNEKTPGTIGNVIRNGWKLHNRCIRSAQVGVVKYQ